MNTSGMRPVNLNVLVKPDAVDEKTKGGILLADTTKERDHHAQTRGVLVDRCPDAFKEMGSPPVPGERLIWAKFEGVEFEGDDGATYRLLKDIDIVGVEIPKAREAAA